MAEDAVWTSSLDDRYTVTVTRTAAYRGEFVIREGDKLLHSKSVGLAYNALFGPDVDDVQRWQQLAIDFVDKRESSKI